LFKAKRGIKDIWFLPEETDLNGRYCFLLVLFAGGQAVYLEYSLARLFNLVFCLLP